MAVDFSYELIRSQRKTLSIQVRQNGSLIVRAPVNMPKSTIERFLDEKSEWIRKNLEKIEVRTKEPSLSEGLSEAKKGVYRRRAKEVFSARAVFFAREMGVKFNHITVREQKTRWGSCSSDCNLNFNWKLILAPSEVLDYVVVHELCHLKEMNHSKAFWEEVKAVLPDYEMRRRWLKENGWKL